MNSMMDMMTIILLFLLKSYSTTGALAAQSESLKLPDFGTGDQTEEGTKCGSGPGCDYDQRATGYGDG